MKTRAARRKILRRSGRLALSVAPPIAGAVCLLLVTGLLLLEGMCAYGECGPDLLGWSLPVLVCWLAGSATWISGFRRRLIARMRGGLALLGLVPAGGWAILETVAWG